MNNGFYVDITVYVVLKCLLGYDHQSNMYCVCCSCSILFMHVLPTDACLFDCCISCLALSLNEGHMSPFLYSVSRALSRAIHQLVVNSPQWARNVESVFMSWLPHDCLLLGLSYVILMVSSCIAIRGNSR